MKNSPLAWQVGCCGLAPSPGYRLPGFLEFHLLRGPERDDHKACSIHRTRSGRAKLALPDGPSPNIFCAPIVTPAPTSRSISAIPSSRAFAAIQTIMNPNARDQVLT